MRAALLAALALTGCWSSTGGSTSDPKPPAAGADVTVELAAVTLADECGDDAAPPPPPITPAHTPPPPPPPPGWSPPANAGAPMPPQSCPAGQVCGRPYQRTCEQTSMQLRIANRIAGGSQNVRVGKVELLDENGKKIGDLVPRKPMRWAANDGQYAPWNELVDGGQSVAVTYALSAPSWDGQPGGRWQAHSHTYLLRVRVVVGTKEKTVEKDAITIAMIEPPVPT